MVGEQTETALVDIDWLTVFDLNHWLTLLVETVKLKLILFNYDAARGTRII